MAAFDAAMEEAAYSKIAAEWEQCKCSNYRTSVAVDSSHYYIQGIWDDYYAWYRPYWEGSAQEQAPVLYPAYEPLVQQDEDCIDATIRIARHNVEACIDSFGGSHADELIPWIPNVGWSYKCGALDKDGERRLLAMLRAKGIDKYVIYNGAAAQTTANWNDFNDLIDQVWHTDADVAVVNKGTCTQAGDLADYIEYSDGDTLDVASVWGTYGAVTRITTDFDVDFDKTPDGLRVHFEADVAGGGAGVTMTVRLYDFENSEWITIGTYTHDNSADFMIDYCDLSADAADYIDGTESGGGIEGTVQVRIFCEMPYPAHTFTTKVDLIQVVGLD